MQIVQLRPEQVAVSDRLRAIDEEEVRKLAVSMRDVGQLTPIEVGPAAEDGRHPLIAGAHRLQAAKLAVLDYVMASVFEGTSEQARLHEIDENLYRRELSPYDQAAFLAERITILRAIHGKNRGGRPGKKTAANLPEFSAKDYLKQTSEQFGIPLRDIRRSLKRHRDIDPAVWKALRGTKWIKAGSALDAIGRLPPDKQLSAVQALCNDRAKTVAGAIKLVTGQAKAAPDYFARAVAAFELCGPFDRQQIVVYLRKAGALDALIADVKAGLL